MPLPSPSPLPSPFPSLGSVPSPPPPGFPGSADGGATIATCLGASTFTCSKIACASAKFVIGGGISRFSVWGAVIAGPALGCPALPLSSWTNCTSTISSDSGVGVWICPNMPRSTTRPIFVSPDITAGIRHRLSIVPPYLLSVAMDTFTIPICFNVSKTVTNAPYSAFASPRKITTMSSPFAFSACKYRIIWSSVTGCAST